MAGYAIETPVWSSGRLGINRLREGGRFQSLILFFIIGTSEFQTGRSIFVDFLNLQRNSHISRQLVSKVYPSSILFKVGGMFQLLNYYIIQMKM